MSRKSKFIENILNIVHYQSLMADVLAERDKEYFDNGYNSGGGDEIVDSDLTDYDITTAQFTNAITLIQQLKNFYGNAAVTQSDYQATLSKLRRANTQNLFPGVVQF